MTLSRRAAFRVTAEEVLTPEVVAPSVDAHFKDQVAELSRRVGKLAHEFAAVAREFEGVYPTDYNEVWNLQKYYSAYLDQIETLVDQLRKIEAEWEEKVSG